MPKRNFARSFVRQFSIAIAALLAIQTMATAGPAYAADPVERSHIRTWLSGESGPLVVLIPGMSTPAEVWRETVEAMEPDHRLLVVEVRGFNGERNTANEQAGVIDGIIDDLASDLDARHLTADAMVGHSFGGALALKFALTHPDQAKQLMVIDALPFLGLEFGPEATIESVTPRAERIRTTMAAQADAMRAAGKTGVKSAPANGMSIDPANATRITNWSMRSEPLATAQAVYELLTTDLREQIAEIKIPVTVLYAAGEDAEKAAQKFTASYAPLANARIVPVENSAHFIMLDRPDVFRAELMSLLPKPE
ncbi:alpha/beta fold hydrolase [Altererythrobacter sp.]|uniref:alpha/beta fold hydrolase n=1 Tax=Altererythrobacter sp. TaxID=1872480 RepID=UPI003CFD4566